MTDSCTNVALAVAVGQPVSAASTRNGMVRDLRSHTMPVAFTRARTSVDTPGSMAATGGSKSASRRPVGSTRYMRQAAWLLPRFSTINS